jgi:CRISPR type III-A-associated protein Csm2
MAKNQFKDWNKSFPKEQITQFINEDGVKYAEEFGTFLGQDYEWRDDKGRYKKKEALTTNQLRKFYGEVKRQQMRGFNKSDFILLKPKLAYAVGRAKKSKNGDIESNIADFYKIICQAIELVNDDKSFKNFIKLFEAIVAYHKKVEPKEKN